MGLQKSADFTASYNQENLKTDLYKYMGIILLTVQQASMPLMVRSARTVSEHMAFITTVNVFFMDVIKLSVCSFILIGIEKNVSKFLASCKKAIIKDPMETLKICIPSMIYNFQNNLYYYALTNLESTTFCVLYQMKIFTTAIMLRFVLKKPLSSTQWMALGILIVGVTNVQLQYQPPPSLASGTKQNPTLGFIAVLTMCFTSAFADGFLIGFDRLVWIMTFTNSAGGLLISVVIKYADNILKAYAQSMAIVGAAIGSWLLFDFVPNSIFLMGTILVIISIYLYTAYPPSKPTPVENEKDSEKQLLIK